MGKNFVAGLAMTMSTIVRKTVNFGTDLFGIVAVETAKLTNETSNTVVGLAARLTEFFILREEFLILCYTYCTY